MQQGRVRRVGLAEPFAQDCVHFAIAGSGGEGDDTLLFQITQNALMDPLYDKFDIRLGGLGRGLEEGCGGRGIRRLGLRRGRVDAIQEQGMEVRVEAKVGGANTHQGA